MIIWLGWTNSPRIYSPAMSKNRPQNPILEKILRKALDQLAIELPDELGLRDRLEPLLFGEEAPREDNLRRALFADEQLP